MHFELTNYPCVFAFIIIIVFVWHTKGIFSFSLWFNLSAWLSIFLLQSLTYQMKVSLPEFYRTQSLEV